MADIELFDELETAFRAAIGRSDATAARAAFKDMRVAAVGQEHLKGRLATARGALDALEARALLAGGGGGAGGAGGAGVASADAKAKLAEASAKMTGGVAALKAAATELEETVAVGEGTVGELGAHRDKLGRIAGKVDSASATMTEANHIVKRMGKWWNNM